MRKFSDLGITNVSSFMGNGIEMVELIDVQIKVVDFVIEPSKFKRKGEDTRRVRLQIEHKGELRVTFSGSRNLIETIEQASPEMLPFTTTIIKQHKSLKFT